MKTIITHSRDSAGRFYISPLPRPKNGFEVYENRGVAAVRVATVGFEGDAGIARCFREIERRLDP